MQTEKSALILLHAGSATYEVLVILKDSHGHMHTHATAQGKSCTGKVFYSFYFIFLIVIFPEQFLALHM